MSDTKSTYFILLRAVNVSGKNILKMAELKEGLTAAGFEGVQTYIQSGNIILQSISSVSKLKSDVETLLLEKFGLSVACFVIDVAYLERAIDRIPWTGEMESNKLFITLLDKTPDPKALKSLETINHNEEQFYVEDNILYYYLPHGMAKSKMNNNYFERKLNVIGTGRNLNTFRKLIELSANS